MEVKGKDLINKLINAGIEVDRAIFHQAVQNGNKTPETNFSSKSESAERRVQMWYTPSGLLCFHKEKYILVPVANLIQADLKC